MLRPLIAAVVLAGPAQAQTAPAEVFQGPPWGASAAQISERFGAELKPALCTASMPTQAVARREVCDHPTLPLYEVAGVPFRLNLVLDAERRQLVRVSSWYAGDAENSPPNLAQDNCWSERHYLANGPAREQYEITYLPVTAGEAGKL